MNNCIVNRNICNFWVNFCLAYPSCWFYDHFFAWYHGTQMYFLRETQKYVEILNTIWIIALYIGILVIFSNFWANFCLIHSSCWLFHYIFASDHGRHILCFRKTQKIDPVLKYDENFCRKLPKIVKFEVNFGYRGKFWTNWKFNA